MKILYRKTRESLVQDDQEYLLPYFFCPIFSDPSVQGASHDTIREKCSKLAVDTRGPRVNPILSEDGFDGSFQESACIVVDDYCLKKFAELQQDEETRETAPMVVLTRTWYVEMYRGWHRAEIGSVASYYQSLSEHGDYRESWYRAYARPPRVYPDGEDGRWKL
ncbi:hypothetical protein N7488_006130 [Penicillium malachiteum]|nr:hypothetical protein N7488_006130 [Penicillium malachiteum]